MWGFKYSINLHIYIIPDIIKNSISNTVAKVGSNVQANDLSLNAATSNKKAAESSQSEFAGVSLDDEASHLLEFQQAYQASARILQTARELFEALIKVV